jgi:hypothetical protein
MRDHRVRGANVSRMSGQVFSTRGGSTLRALQLQGLSKPVGKLVGVASNRRVENRHLVRIVGIEQRLAVAYELESCFYDLRLDGQGVDAVKRLRTLVAGAGVSHVIDDNEGSARL